LIQNI